METLRIACISGFAIPTIAPIHPDYSGLEWMCGLRAYHFSELGHEVTVYCASGSRVPNCKVIEVVDPIWRGTVEFEAYNKFKDELNNYDVVIEDTHFKPFLYDENRKYKLVSVFHDWNFANDKSITKHADLYICPSKSHAENISKQIKSKVKYIYHGIPVKYFPHVKEKEDYILFIGRITFYKLNPSIIDIAKECKSNLIIAGMDDNVESEEFVWKVMMKCQENNFLYLGKVDFDTKVELLSRAKALVLPYDNKVYRCVFELIIVESLACGTPVLITNCNSAEVEILGGVGLTKYGYVAKDINDLKNAVKMLIEDEIDFDSDKIRKYVEKKFNSIKMAKEYIKKIKLTLNKV